MRTAALIFVLAGAAIAQTVVGVPNSSGGSSSGGATGQTTVNGNVCALGSSCTVTASQITTGTLPAAQLPSTFSITGPITLSGSGAGQFVAASGTTPSAPSSGSFTLFFNSANSNHLSIEDSTGTVTDLQATTASTIGPVTTVTASNSATLAFPSLISGSYNLYVCDVKALLPATNTTNLLLRVSTNGGTSYDSSSIYNWNYVHAGNNTGTPQAPATSSGYQSSAWTLVDSVQNSTVGIGLHIIFYDPGNASLQKVATWSGGYTGGGTANWYSANGSGQYASTTAVNAFEFLMSSGNITSGSISCYGVSH